MSLLEIPEDITILIMTYIELKYIIAFCNTNHTGAQILEKFFQDWLNRTNALYIEGNTFSETYAKHYAAIKTYSGLTTQSDLTHKEIIRTMGTCRSCRFFSCNYLLYTLYWPGKNKKTERFPSRGLFQVPTKELENFKTSECVACYFQKIKDRKLMCEDCGTVVNDPTELTQDVACVDGCCIKTVCDTDGTHQGCVWACWGCGGTDYNKLTSIERVFNPRTSNPVYVKTTICHNCKTMYFSEYRELKKVTWYGISEEESLIREGYYYFPGRILF